jgi:hypothetical protein
MSRTVLLSMMFAVLLLLSSRDPSASLLLPDREFSFSAPMLEPQEATDVVRKALEPLGFKIARTPRIRNGGFFRAEFERAPMTSVALMGRVSCVNIGIYTSLSRTPKTAKAIQHEATEIYDQLLASLGAASPHVFLFKSSGGKGGCEVPL